MMTIFTRGISEGLRLVECHVSSVVSRQSIKRSLDGTSMLLTHRQNPLKIFPQSFRMLMTSCGPQDWTQNSFTSEVARHTLSRIEKFGINIDDIRSNPELNVIPINVLEQRLQYFAEGGVTPSILCLTKFGDLAKSSIPVLKAADMLPVSENVAEKMLSSVSYDGPPPTIDENAPYEVIHFQILIHCMEYFFGHYLSFRKKYIHASLHFTLENIKSLKGAKISWQWIRDHPSILYFANPHNLARLSEVDKRYKLPIRLSHLLRLNKDIAFVNFEDYLSTFFILKKYEVCKHDMKSVRKADHFIISPDILDSQIKKLQENFPSLDKNILESLYKMRYITTLSGPGPVPAGHLENMIARQNFSLANINQHTTAVPVSWQQEMKLWFEEGNANLEFEPCRHKPFSSEPDFDAISKEGESSLEKGKYMEKLPIKKNSKLPNFLASELDLTVSEVKTELSHIPLCLTVNINQAHHTLKLLIEYGFSKEDIKMSMQLLLFPRNIVKKTLDQLVFADPIYGSQTYRGRHLQLCLYHILMKYNYSLCD